MVPERNNVGLEKNASCRNGKKQTDLRSSLLLPPSSFHVHCLYLHICLSAMNARSKGMAGMLQKHRVSLFANEVE